MGADYIRMDDVFFLSNSELMDKSSMFFSETEIKTWKMNNFKEHLDLNDIPVAATRNHKYTVLRTEALNQDINNFNLCFNIDQDYHAPYNTERLPI